MENKGIKMEDCCVREKTLAEEIAELDIDETVKERILGKVFKLEKEVSNQQDYLFNCHCEIDQLTCAVVEQAKMLGKLAYENRNMSIRCLGEGVE